MKRKWIEIRTRSGLTPQYKDTYKNQCRLTHILGFLHVAQKNAGKSIGVIGKRGKSTQKKFISNENYWREYKRERERNGQVNLSSQMRRRRQTKSKNRKIVFLSYKPLDLYIFIALRVTAEKMRVLKQSKSI